MKKLLLSATILGTFALTTVTGQNLFSNPGFEDPVNDTNWKWRVDTKNSTATYEVAADAKEGQNTLHVNVSNLTYNEDGYAQDRWDVKLQQTLSFEEGKTYELGFWVKGTAQTLAMEFEILFGQRNDGTKVFLTGYDRLDVAGDWTYLTKSFTVPEEADFDPTAAEVSLLFLKMGDFYLDAVSLRKVEIEDGSFEAETWTNTIRADRGAVATIDYITSDASHGTKALKASVTTQGQYIYDIATKHNITIEDGADFRITFDAKANTNGVSFMCFMPQLFTSTTQAPEFLLTNQWKQYSLVMNYNNVKPAKVRELIFYFNQEGITYWLDNVTVTQITPAANTAPVVNAGAAKTVKPGEVVTLTANVTDPEGDLFKLWWSLPETYDEAALNITSSADRKKLALTFTAPEVATATDLTFSLAANDNLLEGQGTVKVTVDPLSTAIEEAPQQTGDLFFPNPANMVLNIAPGVSMTEFYSVQGELVKKQPVTSPSIDIADLPSGIYILRMTMNDGSAVISKLLKR